MTPHIGSSTMNRQTIHLSNADPCSDQPGHLSAILNRFSQIGTPNTVRIA